MRMKRPWLDPVPAQRVRVPGPRPAPRPSAGPRRNAPEAKLPAPGWIVVWLLTPGLAISALEPDGNLIDLRRQDEVVLAQSGDGVGPELDGNLTISFEMQVGMMSFLFG